MYIIMSFTNPANWVTFEDDSTFQSVQKSLSPAKNPTVPRPNVLKLNLSAILESSSDSSSSANSTPLSSPVTDFPIIPGPPYNSPLSSPMKDHQGGTCIPVLGSDIFGAFSGKLQRTSTFLPSPGTDCTPSPMCVNSTSDETSFNPLFLRLPPPTTPVKLNHSSTPSKRNCILNVGNSPVSNLNKGLSEDNGHSSAFNTDRCAMGTLPSDSGAHVLMKDSANDPCQFKNHELNGSDTIPASACLSYNSGKLEHFSTEEMLRRSFSRNADIKPNNIPPFVTDNLFKSQNRDGWPFMLRIPEKKNMMSSRQWGPIYLRVSSGGILQMYYEKGLEKPFKEFQLQIYHRLSESKLEHFNDSGKIHTVKIENVTYTEKRKYHPKSEVVHEAEFEQLLKLGTTDYNDFKDFITTVEEELLRLPPLSKQRKNYEEPAMTLEILDNFWGKITRTEGKLVESSVLTQLYCVSFLNGNPECFLTLNDIILHRNNESYFEKGIDDQWIEINDYCFQKCVKEEEFKNTRIIKFVPPDACKIELMRFRTHYSSSDIPISIKAAVSVQGAYTELQAFLNMSSTFIDPAVPNVSKYCENVMIQFPVPDDWVKAFRTVNLLRQRSLKAKMNRSTCLGSLNDMGPEPVVQVTTGTAKYESAYKAIVWRIEKLPDKNSDHPHSFSCKLELGSDQEIPSDWYPFVTVEFDMPDTHASGTKVKSLGTESDFQPQKHIFQKARYHCQPKLYQSVIDDVIERVHDLFLDEGADEQVLKELKKRWESKVLQSKAIEGFFRESCSQQFVLQLPQSLRQTLPGSTASIVIPAGRTIQNFTADVVSTPSASATFTLPAGISYPIQVPSGVTLQTASGHLYKVNVPVMVSQAPGGYRILQHPVRHILQQHNRSTGLNILNTHQAPLHATVIHNLSSQQPRIVTHQPPAPRPVVQDKELLVYHNAQNISGVNYSSLQQAAGPQQQQSVMTNLLIQQNGTTDNYGYESMHSLPLNDQLSAFSQGCAQGQDITDLNELQQNLQDKVSSDYTSTLQQSVADDIVELILLDGHTGETSTAELTDPVQSDLQQHIEQELSREEHDTGIGIDDIIQIDGTYDSSSDDEAEFVQDVEDSEFLGIINSEDLKALEEGDDSSSSDDLSSSSEDDNESEVEEDPLNSGDDVSEQEVPDLFDTDNVIVCQYDKIHRSKNKWKFYLKDGVMSFGGKDYIFSKAIGEAEW
ncbi:stonin-1-like [Protopterus annectens]|uniref:stonin-1-like n=1 Tax=Protopterus annectens TaxID=7888 RepID=UPI001CF9AE45|nr:stonin-1-like [Protopterus annectens]